VSGCCLLVSMGGYIVGLTSYIGYLNTGDNCPRTTGLALVSAGEVWGFNLLPWRNLEGNLMFKQCL